MADVEPFSGTCPGLRRCASGFGIAEQNISHLEADNFGDLGRHAFILSLGGFANVPVIARVIPERSDEGAQSKDP